MDNLEYIETYFDGTLDSEEKKVFQERLISDKPFAEEVALYLSIQEASEAELGLETEKRFRELYRQNPPVMPRKPVKVMWTYAAAASVIIAVVSLYFLFKSPVQENLANSYIKDNFTILGVSMAGEQNEMQHGIQLFNEEKFQEAIQSFKKIADRDTADYLSKTYLGISYLRLKDYDKALAYFRKLENDLTLRANPSKFYSALVLMKRDKQGDKEQAKLLLRQVVEQNLQGKQTAELWLAEF